jgi:hypothetical protein
MTSADLLPAAVLKRKAVVYVRQSTRTQVQTNLESRRRQYELVDLARRRGFREVEVIDDDLGRPSDPRAAAANVPDVRWTHERIQRDAEAAGPATAALIEVILHTRRHPEQGFRSRVGILRLAKGYGSDRLEAASERALAIGAHSYTSLASILKSGLDRQAPKEPHDTAALPAHLNLRGAGCYH